MMTWPQSIDSMISFNIPIYNISHESFIFQLNHDSQRMDIAIYLDAGFSNSFHVPFSDYATMLLLSIINKIKKSQECFHIYSISATHGLYKAQQVRNEKKYGKIDGFLLLLNSWHGKIYNENTYDS